MPITGTRGFEIAGLGDWYLADHRLVLPQPVDMVHIPPHPIGRTLAGYPAYQGYAALEARWAILPMDQVQALFGYYIVGDDTRAPVTIGYWDPQQNRFLTMTGFMHEPRIGHLEVRLYYDVVIRFSHLGSFLVAP